MTPSPNDPPPPPTDEEMRALMGHPTYSHSALLSALSEGSSVGLACLKARIRRRTYIRWRDLGDDAPGSIEALWLEDIHDALAAGREQAEALLAAQAERNDAANRWRLSRLYPEDWGDPAKRHLRDAERRRAEAEAELAETRARTARVKLEEDLIPGRQPEDL